MARIRSIKPEFFTSEQIAECSTSARLLFVGLWCFCDDGGVHPASVKRLKMEVFPGDPIADDDVQRLVDELLQNDLLVEFSAEGQRYWHVPTWEKHQKIDRPTIKHPRPDGQNSTITRRMLDEPSTRPRDGTERRGMERNGINTEEGAVDSEEHQPEPKPEAGKPSLMEFPLKDGSIWTLTRDKLDEYRATFPEIDVEAEVQRARQWCQNNSTKRKTASGMSKFFTSWFAKVKAGPKSGAAFSAIDVPLLRDTGRLLDWFETQQVIPANHENRVWILAAAEQALTDGKKPAAWFVDLVKDLAQGKQAKLKDVFYDRAKLRLRDWNMRDQISHEHDQPRAPRAISDLLAGVSP